jgi:hypothetical protein
MRNAANFVMRRKAYFGSRAAARIELADSSALRSAVWARLPK